MSSRLVFRFGSAAALGVAVAVAIDKPEASKRLLGNLALYCPSSFQNFFLRHRIPADYPRLRLHYPKQAEELYFWGERKKSLHAIEELIDSGRFDLWLVDQPDSREAIFCVLILARQSPVIWRKILTQLENFTGNFTDSPGAGKLREIMSGADWEEISILVKAGFLPENFQKFKIPAQIWAAAALLFVF